MPSKRLLPPPPSPETFLASYSPSIGAIAHELRAVVRSALPEVVEAVRVGWALIGYSVRHGRKASYVGYVAPHADRVMLGFEYGYLMTDPFGLIGGDTKRVKTITVREMREIQPEPFVTLIREAARIAQLSRDERALLEQSRRG